MTRRVPISLVLMVSFAAGSAMAQDASTVIRRAVKAMGDVKSVRYSGTGRQGVVGMNWNPTAPWHATVQMCIRDRSR